MQDTMKAQPRWIAGIEPPSELRTQSMTSIYEKECREQPERLAELIRAYSEQKSIREELDKLRHIALSPGPVLFAGMGASYCSSVTGSIWLQSCGRSSFFVDAGEWLHYARAVRDRVSVSILLTTSGESAELVQLFKEDTHSTIALPIALLCNNEKSTCWTAAQIRLPILAGPEYGNATKTYTNSTAACIAIASHIAGRAWRADAAQVLEVYSGDLDRVFDQRTALEEFCRGAANIEVVGRGAAYGAAILSSLCIREMTGQRAAAHSGGGFRHGPLLDVNESHVAIILALGREAELGMKLAHDCNARGGKVILVGSEEREASEKLMPVKVSAVPEPWEGLISVIAAQALTLGMVERYGAKLPPRFQYGVMEE